MRRVRLEDGCEVWVAWLSARAGNDVRHTCPGGTWHDGERVSPIVEVLPE